MFDKDSLDKRIGPLKKSTILEPLEEVEFYVVKQLKKRDIKTAYDVVANEPPYFQHSGYTSYATNFWINPLSFKMRNEQMHDALFDDVKKINDWSGYLKDVFRNKNANKYQDREVDTKYDHKDNLVVLPGSNKLKERVCLKKLLKVHDDHKDNVWFKPHPITKHTIIGEVMDNLDEYADKTCVLPRESDLYYFLEKAKKIYTTHISESAIYEVILGKKIEPIDNLSTITLGSFYPINKWLFDYQDDNIEGLINKMFSSPKSGIINPIVDENWKEKVDLYIEYICNKREKYKNWYVHKDKAKK